MSMMDRFRNISPYEGCLPVGVVVEAISERRLSVQKRHSHLEETCMPCAQRLLIIGAEGGVDPESC